MTVSRVINQPASVSTAIQKTVRDAIARLDYVPNLLAGGLAAGRTRLVSAIVPTIAHAMFSASVQDLTDRLAAAGYQVLLGLSGYPTATREDELVRAILSRRPEALYLTGTSHSSQTRKQLRAAKIPIVETWDLSRKPLDMAVGFSHAAVGASVADYLHRKGHRSFAAVSASDERAQERYGAYAATLAALGAAEVTCVMTPAPSTLPMGRDGLAELIARGFTRGAIYCSSDQIAHGVVIEAQSRGLKIPADIAVIGFGDLGDSAYAAQPLSTVFVDRGAIGRLAAEALLTRLSGMTVAQKIVDVGFKIVERATT
jgi:LacI family gluconate utilization system Gnt-I transcriptional repressor